MSNRCYHYWRQVRAFAIRLTNSPGNNSEEFYDVNGSQEEQLMKNMGDSVHICAKNISDWDCGEKRTTTCEPGATGRYMTIQIDSVTSIQRNVLMILDDPVHV